MDISFVPRCISRCAILYFSQVFSAYDYDYEEEEEEED